MNYLAHAFLSSATPESVVGGILGDFVKGSNLTEYENEIADNIRLHRKIDIFTDQHSIFIQSKSLISAERRRYSGVMVDIFYDHFLARYWNRFSTTKLESFTCFVYASLSQHSNALPQRLSDLLPNMIKDDWLASYSDKVEIIQVINKISHYRIKRSNTLLDGGQELFLHYERFKEHFFEFFPQLIQYVFDSQCAIRLQQ